MKIGLILAATAMVLLIPFLSNSYAQSEQSTIYLLLQLEIRDESGALVGFIESDRATIFDYQTLSDFLDTNGEAMDKRNFTINDQQVEVYSAAGTTTHTSQTVYSHSVIAGPSGIVAYANHDGFLINPGDMTISNWTIIRTVS